MKSVCTALGLSADAAEEVVLTEVTKLQNRAKVADETVGRVNNRVSELEKQNGELLGAQVEVDLQKYSNRIKAEAKEVWKKHLLANRAAAIELLESMAESKEQGSSSAKAMEDRAGSGQQKAAGAMHNRGSAKTPEGNGTEGTKGTEARKAVENYRLANRCSFQAAWDAVRRERPELFTEGVN